MDWNAVDWNALLAMNGYGGFVWPAYAVTLVVLVAVLAQSVRSARRRKAALDALQPTERRERSAAARKAAARPLDVRR